MIPHGRLRSTRSFDSHVRYKTLLRSSLYGFHRPDRLCCMMDPVAPGLPVIFHSYPSLLRGLLLIQVLTTSS